jgi:hypothetical protein
MNSLKDTSPYQHICNLKVGTQCINTGLSIIEFRDILVQKMPVSQNMPICCLHKERKYMQCVNVT